MNLLIIRPQPAADRTAKAAKLVGLTPIVMPLFEIAALPWQATNAADFDALLLTSGNALHYGGEGLSQLKNLPALAVGDATADEARRAGLAVAITGDAGKAALLAAARDAGFGKLLWLSGKDHIAGEEKVEGGGGIILRHIAVYEARKLPAPPDFARQLAAADVAALYSPRAARHFNALLADAGIGKSAISIAALSPAIAAAAGGGWHDIAVAERREDTALLLAAQSLAR
ncbi:MAG: uroporphyrinogen-III synthase [Sphingorhabdus sp.]